MDATKSKTRTDEEEDVLVNQHPEGENDELSAEKRVLSQMRVNVEEQRASTSMTLPPMRVRVVDVNGNEWESNEVKKQRKVKVLFIVAILLFVMGVIMCIVGGVMATFIWCHDRNGSLKCNQLKEMKFPSSSSDVTVNQLVDWAKKFNDIRAENKALAKTDQIKQDTKTEVCDTFEKFPGLYNKHVTVDKKKIEEEAIYYYVFFAQFLFYISAVLVFFIIMFLVDEHIMLQQGGDAYENLSKCSLVMGIVCSVSCAIGCILLAVGVSNIHEDFLKEVLTTQCQYRIEDASTAAMAPGAIAAITFFIASPVAFIMYRD